MRATGQARIEPLAQAVADQIDRDQQHAEAQAGREPDPRRCVEEGRGSAIIRPQSQLGGCGAEAEEDKRGAEQDGEGDAQAALDDDAAARRSAGSRATGWTTAPSPRARAACTKSSSSSRASRARRQPHHDRDVDQADGQRSVFHRRAASPPGPAGRAGSAATTISRSTRAHDDLLDARRDGIAGEQAERHAEQQADRHGAEADRQRELRAGQRRATARRGRTRRCRTRWRAGRLQPDAHGEMRSGS